MLAHVESLVGGVDDQRVIQQIVLLQIIEHDTDVPIHGMDHPKVIVHITLVFPLSQLLTRAFLRLEVLDDRIVIGVPSGFLVRIHAVIKLTAVLLQIGVGGMDLVLLIGHFQVVYDIHILDDAHLLLRGGDAAGVIVVEVLGQREGHIIVKTQVAGIGHPSTVRGLMVQQEAERLALVSFIVQPIKSQIGRDVRGVPFDLTLLAVIDEDGVIVIALAYEDVPVIETGGIGGEVPFADHGGLVASFTQ